MMKKIIVSLAVVSVFSCASVKKHNESIVQLHSVADLKDDVDKVKKQLVKHHPKIYQYILKEEFDRKFDSLNKTIAKPINSQDFFEKLAPVIGSIRQGHISIVPPFKRFSKEDHKKRIKQEFDFNKLDFEEFNDRVYVLSVVGEKDSLLVGAEVIKVDGEPVADLVNTFKSYFTSDGYNETLKKRFVKNRFRSYCYLNKGVIDSLNITFKKRDSTFLRTFKRVAKAKVNKDTIQTAKKITKVERKKNKLKQKEKWEFNDKYGYIKSRKEFTRNFNYIGKDSTVAYIKIRGFTSGSYKEFYKESFAKIDSLKTESLIIDLRDNSGGRLTEIDNLYSYLSKENYVLVEPCEVNSRMPYLKMFMSNTRSIGRKVLVGAFSPFIYAQNLLKVKKVNGKLFFRLKQSKIKEPSTLGFKGNLYVLINGNSFSASSVISTKLKATNRAVFVGEETGGSYNGTVAGIFKNYQLPNSKVKVRIGLMQLETPHKIIPNGYGVTPDIEIIPTLEDRLSGNDPELNWILNQVEKETEK